MNIEYTCQGCHNEFYLDKLCPHFIDEVKRFNNDETGWPDIRCIKCCDELDTKPLEELYSNNESYDYTTFELEN